MDGRVTGLPSLLTGTVLQRFLIDRAPARRELYWRDGGAAGSTPGVAFEDAVLRVAAGGTLGFDTYFNGFFEAQWLRHTTLQSLALQVTLSGTALLRIHRHALGRKDIITEAVVGPGSFRIPVPLAAINFRQYGVLTVELCAMEEAFSFVGGAWLTEDVPAQETGLAAVFCTFNREADIARVIGSIGADEGVLERLERVFVVNQGRTGLARVPVFAHAAKLLVDRLTTIEQGNFGGAGGFSRGLLAALADPAITHAVLLDDDIELEPDSLLRMAAFFSFCDRDVVLGGHMLDMLHPTMLYEAGAVISERDWTFLPQHFQLSIGQPDTLELLSRPYPVHYNGWWCCGLPLSVVREHGMPLPCFIRGDDMEFGLRLHQRGIPTVPMPGVAVWHEPFYLKLGNWQLYYETRNLLVAMALHQPAGRLGVLHRMGRHVVTHLLTYRYYSTALILQGIRDFLTGPDTMREPPLQRHLGLGALKRAYPTALARRETVAHKQCLRPVPRGRLRCLGLLAWLLGRNAVLPSCEGAARRLQVEDMHWIAIREAGHVATETWWDADLPTYRRTREHHRALVTEAAGLLLRLVRTWPKVAATWRTAAPELTSVPAWNRYLGLSDTLPKAGRLAEDGLVLSSGETAVSRASS